VSRHNRKRRPRARTTTPGVPPRAPRRIVPSPPTRSREDRPKAPWAPIPLVEIAVFVGMVLLVIGVLSRSSTHGRVLLVTGLALGSLGGLDTAVREHFAGYRSHALVLAAFPAVATMTLTAVVRAPWFLVPALGIGIFAAVFTLLRGVWDRATGDPEP
jgi:hypothetical protein